MTYLTLVNINPHRNRSKSFLASRQVAHSAVRSSFVEFPGRILWRLERGKDKSLLRIISEVPASVEHIVEQFGWPQSAEAYDTIDYDPLISNITNDSLVRFDIELNPSSKDDLGKWRFVGESQLPHWVMSKMQDSGILVEDLRLTPVQTINFKRGGSRVTLASTSASVLGRVKDSDLFASAIRSGVGRGKGYGFGLVSMTELISNRDLTSGG